MLESQHLLDTRKVSVLEIAPGIFHWSATHPIIRVRVSSYYLRAARTVLDPLVPAEGFDSFEEREPPLRVLLTNRLHTRHTHRFVEAFGCEVWTNREGLAHFGPDGEIQGLAVRGFEAGEILPGNLESFAIGALCPDETAFRVPGPEPALAIADGVVRDGDGPLTFVPDALLGDDPEAIKRGLRAAYASLLSLEFDHLLLAHGDPWIGGGRDALRSFIKTP